MALVAFSSGWLLPLYFSVDFLLMWCDAEVAPVVYGSKGQLNSFPYLAEAWKLWGVAMLWLTAVVLFWSIVAANRLVFGSWKSTQLEHAQPRQ